MTCKLSTGTALGLVELAPNFQQLRVLSILDTAAVLHPCGCLFIILMCSGLSKDNFMGYCDPVSDPLLMLRNLFAWRINTSCVDSESREVYLASLSKMADIGCSLGCMSVWLFGVACWVLTRRLQRGQNETLQKTLILKATTDATEDCMNDQVGENTTKESDRNEFMSQVSPQNPMSAVTSANADGGHSRL